MRTFANLEIDPSQYRVRVGGHEVSLTFTEFELLTLLAERPNVVVSRDELSRRLWPTDVRTDDRRIDIHLSRLRKKLGRTAPWRVETVRRRGYIFTNAGL